MEQRIYLDEKNEEIIRLRKEIDRYNNSRKWYERKINID